MITTDYEKVFKALADKNRLELLQKISVSNEVCVCKLMDEASMAQSRLSYHLRLLLDAGLITVKPQGKWNFYSINRTAFSALFTDNTIKKLFNEQ